MSAPNSMEKRKSRTRCANGVRERPEHSGKLGVLAPPQAGLVTLRRCRWTALLLVMFKEADAKA